MKTTQIIFSINKIINEAYELSEAYDLKRAKKLYKTTISLQKQLLILQNATNLTDRESNINEIAGKKKIENYYDYREVVTNSLNFLNSVLVDHINSDKAYYLFISNITGNSNHYPYLNQE